MSSSLTVTAPYVIVGLSGGVDSSVSAALLLEQGYKVEGLFMKNWEEDDGTEYCTAKADLADAQSVCDQLGIKLHSVNFSMEYWDFVFEHFLAEYKAGRTPNPDILCNKEIKFKAFLDYALQLGADYIATGHYANTQLINNGTQAQLLRGVDTNKDQSYFLHAVAGDKLAKTLFPIGHLEKPAVRELAQKYQLRTATKKDSTGICFIGERRFRDFLQQYLPAQSGDIVDEKGTVLGKHTGLMFYTLGQREGIGLGGIRNRDEAPWYVLNKDMLNNRLIVGQGHDNPLLFSTTINVDEIDWINPTSIPQTGLTLTAKVRYRQPDQIATIYSLSDGGYEIVFAEPQRAVTPGQSLVLYNNEVCLGGGVITQTNAPQPFLHH